MYSELTLDNSGKVKNTASAYQPSKKVREVIASVQKDYQTGITTRNQERREFNNRNLIDEVNDNQQRFNSYVPPKSENPDDDWRAQTVRPVTRNKLISIAAHVTATILYPTAFAQNDKDKEDKAAAEVMERLMEWNIDNSDYVRNFINGVMAALVDPAVVMKAEFVEAMIKVKEMNEDGSYTTKEVIDAIMSGWNANVVPCTELLIANIYEPNIQKQRFLIHSKQIDYDEAKVLYGNNKNWKYVRPGVLSVFSDETATFYDVADDSLNGINVQVDSYYNRYEDCKLVFVNGVLMTASDAPNPRKDKRYPFAKSGYEPLNNGLFFYYKSAANKLGSDQDLVDTLYNMILDGTYLQLMPPMALYGNEEVDSSVMVPGTITSFESTDSKLESIAPRTDLRAGLETIGMVERSITESSQDNLRSGMSNDGAAMTAREITAVERNAQIQLGLFGKMIGFLVEDIGTLMVGDICQHMTVMEVSEINSGESYKSFLLPNKTVEGRSVTEEIRFGIPDNKEVRDLEYDLLAEEGGLKGKKKIYMVNPELFRNLKYKIKVSVEKLVPKSKALEKALGLEQYDRLIQNDLANKTEVTRDLIGLYQPGNTDKYMKEEEPGAPSAEAEMQKGFQQKGVNSNMVSQLTGNNSLGVAASSDM